MQKGKIINSWEIMPFALDEAYSSKMLLDDAVAGARTVQINEGTLRGGQKTGGGVHEKDEIYYVVSGEAVLHLDDEAHDVRAGSLVFIPAGVFHSLDNKSETEDFVLLTIWMKAKYNEVYNLRKKAWGRAFKTIYEE